MLSRRQFVACSALGVVGAPVKRVAGMCAVVEADVPDEYIQEGHGLRFCCRQKAMSVQSWHNLRLWRHHRPTMRRLIPRGRSSPISRWRAACGRASLSGMLMPMVLTYPHTAYASVTALPVLRRLQCLETAMPSVVHHRDRLSALLSCCAEPGASAKSSTPFPAVASSYDSQMAGGSGGSRTVPLVTSMPAVAHSGSLVPEDSAPGSCPPITQVASIQLCTVGCCDSWACVHLLLTVHLRALRWRMPSAGHVGCRV